MVLQVLQKMLFFNKSETTLEANSNFETFSEYLLFYWHFNIFKNF